MKVKLKLDNCKDDNGVLVLPTIAINWDKPFSLSFGWIWYIISVVFYNEKTNE